MQFTNAVVGVSKTGIILVYSVFILELFYNHKLYQVDGFTDVNLSYLTTPALSLGLQEPMHLRLGFSPG